MLRSKGQDIRYGLLAISRGRTKCIEADYSISTATVFWNFFATHIDGIDHIRDDGTGRPIKLPIEEVLDDWWHYALRIMSSMGINQSWLRKDVVKLLVKTFEVSQRDWLANGLLKAEQQ